jgi:hypothetical protein
MAVLASLLLATTGCGVLADTYSSSQVIGDCMDFARDFVESSEETMATIEPDIFTLFVQACLEDPTQGDLAMDCNEGESGETWCRFTDGDSAPLVNLTAAVNDYLG